MTQKPFAYLEGLEPAYDAPVMDNPARLYCPQCRSQGQQVCGDPGMCGNLRPMKPLPASEMVIEHAPQPKHAPRPHSAELKGKAKPVQLDDSGPPTTIIGREQLYGRQKADKGRQSEPGHAFDRVMGRRTIIRTGLVVDGEEKSWDWFMENINRDVEELSRGD